MNISLKQGRYNRIEAQERGDTSYESQPCKKCGSPLRYTKSGGCIDCSISRSLDRYHGRDAEQTTTYNQNHWRANRKSAKDQGLTTYNGKPCAVCSGTLRYTCNKTCVKCHSDRGKARRATTPQPNQTWYKENRIRQMLLNARNRAGKRGLAFDLTEDQIVIPSHCPVLGIELTWEGDRANSPSLDRLDNSKGYTLENCRMISFRANSLKSDATLEEMQSIVRYMESAT